MSSNEQGVLGETIFNIAISRGYLFRPKGLGGKWPVSDFYVELISLGQHYHFFVQVKSTVQGLDTEGNLKVVVDKEKVEQLRQYHAPTYIAGVDIRTEKVYMISVNHSLDKSIQKIPTRFEVVEDNLKILFNEVTHFWNNSGIEAYKSNFNHQL